MACIGIVATWSPVRLEEGVDYPKSSKNLVGFLHMGKLCVQIFFQKRLVWPSIEEQLESWLEKSQIMLSLWPHEDGPRDKKPIEL